jgi:hypothetical protein
MINKEAKLRNRKTAELQNRESVQSGKSALSVKSAGTQEIR